MKEEESVLTWHWMGCFYMNSMSELTEEVIRNEDEKVVYIQQQKNIWNIDS